MLRVYKCRRWITHHFSLPNLRTITILSHQSRFRWRWFLAHLDQTSSLTFYTCQSFSIWIWLNVDSYGLLLNQYWNFLKRYPVSRVRLCCELCTIVATVSSDKEQNRACVRTWSLLLRVWQVPPDFYIPDFDEDEQNPDERVDRKWKLIKFTRTCTFFFPFILLVHAFRRWEFSSAFDCFSFQNLWKSFAEHTRDKQIQRDDEYYDGDNDNDQNMDDS